MKRRRSQIHVLPGSRLVRRVIQNRGRKMVWIDNAWRNVRFEGGKWQCEIDEL